jgi:hypothetical protein
VADQELLIVVRMRDEASAVLKQATAAMRELGVVADVVTQKTASFRSTLQVTTTTATSFDQASKTATAGFTTLTQTLTQTSAGADRLGTAMQTASTQTGALGRAGNTAGRQSATLFQTLKAGMGAARVAIAALEPLIDLYGKAVDRTIQYEKSQNALNSAMRLSGGAIGMTKGAVNDVVNETASRTRTDDQELRNAAALLINQGEATSGTFKEALDVSTKLAFVMGTDVVSASRLVANAMVDPKQGMEALREAGIKLKASERDRIAAMQQSGDKIGAQAELLRAVSKETGSAEGANKGLSGSFRNLSHASGEFLNQFNDSVLSRMTTGIVNFGAGVIRTLTIFEEKTKDKQTQELRKELAVYETRLANFKASKIDRDPKDWDPQEQAEAAGYERHIQRVRGELAKISAEFVQAIDKGAQAIRDGAEEELRREIGKKGYALDKAGNLTSKEIVDADAEVARATKLRDLLKAVYEEFERLAKAGEVYSPEKFNRALQNYLHAERLLTEEMETAARARQNGGAAVVAACEASVAAEGKVSETLSRVTSHLVLFNDGLADVGRGILDFAGKASLVRSSFDLSSLLKPPESPQKYAGIGIRPMTELLPDAPSGGFGGAGDALKSLRDEVARLDRTLKALPEGPYAVRKAEMDSRASGVGSAEADLLRQTFGQREKIASTTAIDNLKKETDLLRQLAAAVGDVNKQNQIRREFENARKLLDVAPADRERLAQAQRDKDEADKQRQEAETAYKTEQDKIEKATAFARETFKGFFSDLKDGLKKGQGLWEAFGNAARNALNKITEKVVDLVSNKLMDQLFEGLGDVLGLGGGSGGKGGGASGGGGDGGIFGFIGKGLKALASFLFADGGIMTSRGPVPLRKYAGGGIATSPQLALFGEGSVPEAYVPVPSGRIPVELRGGGLRGGLSGGMTVQTNISVNMTAPAGGQGSGGSDGRGNMMEQARELGAIVTAMVNKNLQDQMRPGGLLNPSGSFSAGVVQ